MKKRRRTHGTPIYGLTYTDTNGVTLRWDSTVHRYLAEDKVTVVEPQEAASSSGKGIEGETMPCQTKTEAPGRRDEARLRECLAQALDSLLAALSSVGGLPDEPPLPNEGFDAALMADADHQANRAAFRAAYQSVYVVLPDDAAQQRLLRLEEAALDLALSASTVAWRLGLVASGRTSGE